MVLGVRNSWVLPLPVSEGDCDHFVHDIKLGNVSKGSRRVDVYFGTRYMPVRSTKLRVEPHMYQKVTSYGSFTLVSCFGNAVTLAFFHIHTNMFS